MDRDIPLREKKFAKTKLAITDEFMRQLKTTRFDAISIQAVCAAVEISEGTFYNYFPRKFDVLTYRLMLQHIQRIWRVEQETKKRTKREQIEHFFELITSEFTEAHIVYELIGAMIDERFSKNVIEISVAEKIYAFPDCPGIEHVDERDISCPDDYIRKLVTEAQQEEEIAGHIVIDEVVTMLMSILVGSTLAIPEEKFSEVKTYVKKHIAILWHGLEELGHE